MKCNVIKFSQTAIIDKYVSQVETDYDKLSERSDEVVFKGNWNEISDIILKLKNTIRANEGMVGLSAPQIGFNKRIICINFNGDIRALINPLITDREGITATIENCHSIPGKEFLITRNNKVSVTYTTPTGKIESTQLVGLAAFILQHQISHLDGILLSDYGLEIDQDFHEASEDDKNAIVQMYLESLDIKKQEIDLSIEDDDDAKQLSDAIKFIQSVDSGETKIEYIPWTQEEIDEYEKNVAEEESKK